MGSNIHKYLDDINKALRKSLMLDLVSRYLAFSIGLSLFLFVYYWFVKSSAAAWVGVLIPIVSLGAVAGYLYTRVWTREVAAKKADAVLQCHDRFSTVLECMKKGTLNPVEKELIARVDVESASADVGSVVTVIPTRETKSLFLLVPLFAILSVSFVYYQILSAITPVLEKAMLAAPVSRLQAKVNELAASGSPEKKDIADKLQKLLNKLKGAKNIDDMLGQAQSLLRQLQASETDPDVKRTLESLSQAATFLSRSKLTRQLSQALKDGDMSKAAGLASNLASKLQNMSGLTSSDLKKLGKNFQKSAAQLGKSASSQGASSSSGKSPAGASSALEKQFKEVGAALQNGDIASANKALAQAGKIMGNVAKSDEARKSFESAGKDFEKSLRECAGKLGKSRQLSMMTPPSTSPGSQGKNSGDNKGAAHGKDLSTALPNDSSSGNNSSSSAKAGSGENSPANSQAQSDDRSSTGRPESDTADGSNGSSSEDSSKSSGDSSQGALTKGPSEQGRHQGGTHENLQGFKADSQGGSGKLKIVDSLPFSLPQGELQDESRFRCEQKVNDYLATQLVPGDYREVINRYFGIEKDDSKP